VAPQAYEKHPSLDPLQRNMDIVAGYGFAPERDEGRNRWIHCTPLLNAASQVGVWMVVVVDDEDDELPGARKRVAPPVTSPTMQSPTSSHHPLMSSASMSPINSQPPLTPVPPRPKTSGSAASSLRRGSTNADSGFVTRVDDHSVPNARPGSVSSLNI